MAYMVTLLIIMLPVMCIVTGLFTAWGIYTGLKWQIQTGRGQEPKPVVNPIKEILELRVEKERTRSTEDLLNEWINGPKEGGE